MKTPTLYQYKVCPFCQKVRAALLYKKVDFKAVEVNPMNKREIAFSKDYKKVPIFIDREGKQWNDSTVIIRTIDTQYPDKPIFETDQEKKQREEKWLKWSDESLVTALTPVVYETYSSALHAFDYIKNSGNLSMFQKFYIKYTGAFFMTRVAAKKARKQGISNPKKHLRNLLAAWTEALNSEPFLGGDTPNGADIAVFGFLNVLKNLPAFSLIKENRPLYDWFSRMQ